MSSGLTVAVFYDQLAADQDVTFLIILLALATCSRRTPSDRPTDSGVRPVNPCEDRTERPRT